MMASHAVTAVDRGTIGTDKMSREPKVQTKIQTKNQTKIQTRFRQIQTNSDMSESTETQKTVENTKFRHNNSDKIQTKIPRKFRENCDKIQTKIQGPSPQNVNSCSRKGLATSNLQVLYRITQRSPSSICILPICILEAEIFLWVLYRKGGLLWVSPEMTNYGAYYGAQHGYTPTRCSIWEVISKLHMTSVRQGSLAGIVLCNSGASISTFCGHQLHTTILS